MDKAYFVTEMDRFDYTGSAVINAYYNEAYLEKAIEKVKRVYPDKDWQIVKLGELYEVLTVATNDTLIVLGRNAKAFKHALIDKYPQTEILLSDDIKQSVAQECYFIS